MSKLQRRVGYLVVFLFMIFMGVVLGIFGFIFSLMAISYVANSRKPQPTQEAHKPLGPILRVPEYHYDAYRAYLKSQPWRDLRKLVLKRDSHRCLRCGYIGHLQVHHAHYEGIATMDFSIDQLESICNECHKAVHQGKLPMKKD